MIRLGLAALITSILLAEFIGLYFTWKHKASILGKIDAIFTNEKLLFTTQITLAALFIGQIILLNFANTSFGHYSEHFNQIRIILWWGASLCGLTASYLMLFNPLKPFLISQKNLLFIIFAITLIMIWYLTSNEMAGRPATTWMGYFQVEDLSHTTPQNIAQFFKEMRAGIPPLISIVEILITRFTGSTLLITREFYRLALLITYLVSALLFADNLIKGAISTIISAIFLSATIVISARNPEIYDIFYPCLLLLFFFFIRATQNSDFHQTSWAFLAGMFLALAELSRPFVLILMPFFLVLGVLSLRKFSRKVLIAFIIPILLISGGWHLKLLIFNNGQIFWSNHSGFNLYRAWGEIAEIPDPPAEPQTWDNRNQIHSQEHYRNSQEIQKAVLSFIVNNPGQAFSFSVSRLKEFLQPRTSFFDEPELGGTLIEAYRLIFAICLVFWSIQLILLGFNLFRKPWGLIFATPQNIILITTTLTVLLLAVSEKGEEARLILAVLPFVAALPAYQLRDELEHGS